MISSSLFKNSSMSDVLFAYLNIFGISLAVAFFVVLGLHFLLSEKKYFSGRRVFGFCMLFCGALLLLRNLVLSFS